MATMETESLGFTRILMNGVAPHVQH
jgi:hypothetical protein